MEIEPKEEARQSGVPFAVIRWLQEVKPVWEKESHLEGDEKGGHSLV